MSPLQRFRTKFRASRVTLPAAAIATAICAASLLVIWFERPVGQEEMDRYGSALASPSVRRICSTDHSCHACQHLAAVFCDLAH